MTKINIALISLIELLSVYILGTESEIIQIAAKHLDSGNRFNRFVKPCGTIPSKITSLTGIEIHGSNMYHNLEHVESVPISESLSLFFDWLRPFGKVVLLAHNANFDARVFIGTCIREGVIEQCNNIVGFVDTCALMKHAFPGRGRKGYNQSTLVKELLNINYIEHDASEDVDALCKLLLLLPKSMSCATHLISLEKIHYNIKRLENEKMNKGSYKELVKNNVISNRQSLVLSGMGFNTNHLILAYKRGNGKGLQELLGKNNRSYKKLTEYFSSFEKI